MTGVPIPPEPIAKISLAEIESVKEVMCPKPDPEEAMEKNLTEQIEEEAAKEAPLCDLENAFERLHTTIKKKYFINLCSSQRLLLV